MSVNKLYVRARGPPSTIFQQMPVLLLLLPEQFTPAVCTDLSPKACRNSAPLEPCFVESHQLLRNNL